MPGTFELTLDPSIARATQLLALEREIAEAAARTTIELFARKAPSNFPHPVWDVSEPDAGEVADRLFGAAEDLERAVRYLDMRELLVRPVADMPQMVSFKQGAR